MKSKTLSLIKRYHRLINEADQPQQPAPQQPAPPQDVQDVVQPEPQQQIPFTSEGEDEMISELIDAALFEPSAEQAKVLLDLQGKMQMKDYTNAREEVLPMVLSIISAQTQAKDLKKNLNRIS